MLDLQQIFEEIIEQHCNQSSREAHYNAAKQCALIAVDYASKHRQHSAYLSNGGTMTMEEWEMDGRWDKSC